MTHVVAEPCYNCKYTSCVTVCPVDCFYEGAEMLFISPDECTDCGKCVDECPPKAIFAEGDLPEAWAGYKDLNAQMWSQSPNITKQQTPLGPPI